MPFLRPTEGFLDRPLESYHDTLRAGDYGRHERPHNDFLYELERNGKPEAMLNMSYTAAKSFAASLGQLVAILEERTGRDMLTTNDLERLLAPRETKQ